MTPVVDYALTRPDVAADQLTLLGMSLGGLWAARAAAFEHRFRAAIFFDGGYDLHSAVQSLLPAEAVAALQSGDVAKGETIIREATKANTALRWTITQGLWSLGASSIAEFVEQTKQHTVKDTVGQIECPCLVLEAEGDMFFAGQPQQVTMPCKRRRRCSPSRARTVRKTTASQAPWHTCTRLSSISWTRRCSFATVGGRSQDCHVGRLELRSSHRQGAAQRR